MQRVPKRFPLTPRPFAATPSTSVPSSLADSSAARRLRWASLRWLVITPPATFCSSGPGEQAVAAPHSAEEGGEAS